MANLVNLQKISLKNHSEIKEDIIQKFIFDNPSVLGLGALKPVERERIQSSGGRLDILMRTEENDARYEIEIQLGATDPNHIIRTIEYWDLEKKRYPQYEHCAVIVAEEITGRFMNVINLFNGAIPLIALQMSAFKNGDEILLTFTKVIDRVELGTDEDDNYEPTDRNYWEKKSSKASLDFMDKILDDLKKSEHLQEYISGIEFKYNKVYIGLTKDGSAINFISFMPQKQKLILRFSLEKNPDISDEFENNGLNISYQKGWKLYMVSLRDIHEYKQHEDLIKKYVKIAIENHKYYR